MPFAAALSTVADTSRALDAVCDDAARQLPEPADLALLFLSPHHAAAAEAVAAAAHKRLQARCLLGCTGEAIVGNDREVEQEAALSLWLGRWPRSVSLESFNLGLIKTAEGHSLVGWPDGLLGADPAQSVLLVLGDPATFPADAFLAEINENQPGLRVMGGMASGGHGLGQNRLIRNDEVVPAGAVGVLLQGAIGLRGVVSQGCRPIGRHMVITRGEANVIAELGGKPPLLQLQELWQELPPADQELCRQGLHIGLVINEYQDQFQRGDFLVRNVLGLDRQSGALAITDRVRVGQTVQFHVRDAQTADEDLHALLQLDAQAHERLPSGGLLFTCNGRGSRLFAEPDHDARAVRAELGNIPLAGFFAQGELGPVGGRNFIHGFTASIALFED